MNLHKAFGLCAAFTFAVVGLIFLITPDAALAFFNTLSGPMGMPAVPLQGAGFYLALGSAYMYLVTLLAYLMYRNPEQRPYPLLLAHAKCASSVLSLYLYLSHGPYLIYAANFVVDGLIGATAFWLTRRQIS